MFNSMFSCILKLKEMSRRERKWEGMGMSYGSNTGMGMVFQLCEVRIKCRLALGMGQRALFPPTFSKLFMFYVRVFFQLICPVSF